MNDCERNGHAFEREAPRLPIRLVGEKEYKRHNYCRACKKWVVI